MIFDSGIHAIAWLINDIGTIYYPASTTGKILDMLQGLSSMSDGGCDLGVDDKHNARIDLQHLLSAMDAREQTLMVTFLGGGVNDAIRLIKSDPVWKDWRDKNRSALENGKTSYSKLIYGVLDRWEKILIENDYMGEK